MTLKEAKAICKELGCSINKTPYGEYRVNFSGSNNEATAYYTDDISDAIATAREMNRTGCRAGYVE